MTEDSAVWLVSFRLITSASDLAVSLTAAYVDAEGRLGVNTVTSILSESVSFCAHRMMIERRTDSLRMLLHTDSTVIPGAMARRSKSSVILAQALLGSAALGRQLEDRLVALRSSGLQRPLGWPPCAQGLTKQESTGASAIHASPGGHCSRGPEGSQPDSGHAPRTQVTAPE